MRTTIGNTVERISRQLASSFRYEVSQLGALLTNSSTLVQLAHDLPPSLRNGAVLSIDNEVMRVLGVDTAAKTATVIRGWQDSDAVAHANGTEISINPRFTGLDIYEAMISELTAWGPDLFRVAETELDVSFGAQTAELPLSMTDAYGVIDVRMKSTFDGNFSLGLPLPTAWPRIDFRLQRSMIGSTAAPTSGMLIRFVGGIGRVNSGIVFVQVALPFDLTAVAFSNDLVDDIGLRASMIDVLEMGVKCRLMGDQEIQRSARVAQDTPRMAEEVPAMAANEVSQRLFPVYQRRKGEEVNRLRHMYAIQFR